MRLNCNLVPCGLRIDSVRWRSEHAAAAELGREKREPAVPVLGSNRVPAGRDQHTAAVLSHGECWRHIGDKIIGVFDADQCPDQRR